MVILLGEKMAIKIPLKISLKDVYEESQRNDRTISRTPFGAPPGEYQYYEKRAVPWKGVKGIDRVREINSGVASGLSRAIAISKAHHEKGKAILVYPDKTRIVVPLKSAMMSVAQHKDYGVRITGVLGTKRPWVRARARGVVAGAGAGIPSERLPGAV